MFSFANMLPSIQRVFFNRKVFLIFNRNILDTYRKNRNMFVANIFPKESINMKKNCQMLKKVWQTANIAGVVLFILFIHPTTVSHILNKDLHMNPSKFNQYKCESQVYYQRITSVNWLWKYDVDFSLKVMFIEEAYFFLEGLVNKQNYCI